MNLDEDSDEDDIPSFFTNLEDELFPLPHPQETHQTTTPAMSPTRTLAKSSSVC